MFKMHLLYKTPKFMSLYVYFMAILMWHFCEIKESTICHNTLLSDV